jgi:hypothetical protein
MQLSSQPKQDFDKLHRFMVAFLRQRHNLKELTLNFLRGSTVSPKLLQQLTSLLLATG